MRPFPQLIAAMVAALLASSASRADAEPVATSSVRADGSDPAIIGVVRQDRSGGLVRQVHARIDRTRLQFQFQHASPFIYYGGVYAGATRLSMNAPLVRGLPMDALLQSDAQLGFFAGVGATAFRAYRLRLTLFAEFETSPSDSPMRVSRLGFTAGQDAFNGKRYAKDHAHIGMHTTTLLAGSTLAYDRGWFRPELVVGIESDATVLNVKLDGDSRDLFRTLGYDPYELERPYRTVLITPHVTGAVTLIPPTPLPVLHRPLSLRLHGTLRATGSEPVLGAGASLQVPLF